MTAPTFQPIETVQRFTPMGIEFWDLLADAPITDGLSVRARAVGHRGRFHAARGSARGVHALIGMPALRPLENLTPDAGEFEPIPVAPTIDLDVLVTDSMSRFLPAALRVTAPQSGLVTASHALLGCASLVMSVPVDSPPFLASAPTRSVSSSLASIRTQVRDRTTGAPAAHAVVTASVGGLQYVGVADEQGQVLLPFPYPPFVDALASDSVPAGAHGVPTSEQTWTVTIGVRSLPVADLEFPDDVDTPIYHSLFCQPAAAIWAALSDGAAAATITADLVHGQELFLRSDGAADAELLIDFAPATSPP